MLKENERKELRLLQTFGPLNQSQIVRYFENTIFGDVNGILRNLKRRHLLVYDRALFQYALPGWRKGNNAAMIKAFYVYLEFQNTVDYVTLADPPGQLCFTRDGYLYEIAVVPMGQEGIVEALETNRHPDTRYLLVLDDAEQANRINAQNIFAVCTVTAGKVQFYEIERTDDFDKEND